MKKELADKLHVMVLKAYKEMRPEWPMRLNRMYLLEVILLYIDAISQLEDEDVRGNSLLELI